MKKGVDKGGKLAKDQMIECLKKGYPGAVTVDGPKGPAFVVKPGIIDMAKKAGVLIVPYGIGMSSYWEFKSWDRFRMPKPFCKILVSYGQPIDVSSENQSFEEHLDALQKALNAQYGLAQKGMEHWKASSDKNWFDVQ